MILYSQCIECKQPFTAKNCHTRQGWAETQISGMCEDCFDALFEGCEDADDVEDTP